MKKSLAKTACVMIAASMLCGCGNNISEGKINSDVVVSEPQITVIGATEGLPEGDNRADESPNANADDEKIPETSEEILPVDINMIQDEASWADEVVLGAHADNKRIVCWGDSLTEGTGGNGISYPSRLKELTGMDVKNYGVYAEKAGLIAAREGGNPVRIYKCEEIPGDCTRTVVALVNEKNGEWELWCNFGDAGINPCEIAGVEGTLEIDPTDGTRYFTRLKPGNPVKLDESNNSFTTFAMKDKKPGDILVIWSGSSDGWDENRSLDAIIEHQKSMIKYAGCTEYVIINYTAKPNIGEEIDAWNARLKKEYGDRVVDARGYLLKHGLEDAGITPTNQDKKDIESGQIPESLRVDESHGTADFYRIIGDLVYKKMIELNYISK